jgi:hypothetical protein
MGQSQRHCSWIQSEQDLQDTKFRDEEAFLEDERGACPELGQRCCRTYGTKRAILATVATTVLSYAPLVHGGCPDGPQSGKCSDNDFSPKVRFRGGELAVVAVKCSGSGGGVKIFDERGREVASAYAQSPGGLTGTIRLVTWTPRTTATFTIKAASSPGTCVYVTN